MIQNYRDLEVWQYSMKLVMEIYSLVKRLPKDENFVLSDQMRRAVISIPSNIAEGYGRNATADYVRFLKIARGSKNELDTQIDICIMLRYFSKEDANTAIQYSESIGRMLNSLINRLAPD